MERGLRDVRIGFGGAVLVVVGSLVVVACGSSSSAGDDDEGGNTGGASGGSAARGGSGGTSSGSSGGGTAGSSGGTEPTGGTSGTSATGGTAGSSGGTTPTGGSSGSGGMLPACSDTPGTGGVPLEELPQRYAEAFCPYYERCTPTDYTIYRKVPGGCVGLLGELYESTAETIRRGTAAGTVRYDGVQMAECFASLPSLDCSADAFVQSSCYCALQGNVAADGDCLTELECAGEARCVPPETGLCATGTCTPRKMLGESCDPEIGDCALGLDCAENIGSGPDFFCAEKAPEGAGCGLFDPPRCAGLLICRAVSSTSGTCERPELVGMGEPCAPVDGIGCLDGECVITERSAAGDSIARCVPVAASGGLCHSGYPDECPPNEYCPLSRLDHARGMFQSNCVPMLEPGEDCNVELFGSDCGEYPFDACNDGTCITVEGIGASCTLDAGCYSGRCSGGTPVCDVPTVCN